MTDALRRKYVLTRIAPGDYMFVSNDGRTLWRVYTYDEDLHTRRSGETVAVRAWAAAHFNGSVAEAESLLRTDPDEFLSWGSWAHWASPLGSRAEAITEALRGGARIAARSV